MQGDIGKVDPSDFPTLERFAKYKSAGLLSSAKEVARKVYYLLSNPSLFLEVVQDVRNFDLP
jgi:benzil reductase ((S)-benzoin forming)